MAAIRRADVDGWYHLSVRRLTNVFGSIVLAVTFSVLAMGIPVLASSRGSVGRASADPASDASTCVRPIRKKSCDIYKNLKLTKRSGSRSIASCRSAPDRSACFLTSNRCLLNRSSLAEKVIEDSNAQIEAFLKTKQRRKFDKELAKDHGAL